MKVQHAPSKSWQPATGQYLRRPQQRRPAPPFTSGVIVNATGGEGYPLAYVVVCQKL